MDDLTRKRIETVKANMRSLALDYAQLTQTEGFLMPIGIGDLHVGLGTPEQLRAWLSDAGMQPYGGKD